MGVDCYGILMVGLPRDAMPDEVFEQFERDEEDYPEVDDWLEDDGLEMLPGSLEHIWQTEYQAFVGFVIAKTPAYGHAEVDMEELKRVPSVGQVFLKLFGIAPRLYVLSQLET